MLKMAIAVFEIVVTSKCKKGEEVVFSWIVWPSKEARDAGNKAAMTDPRLKDWNINKMPFDGKRMIFGGFKTLYPFNTAVLNAINRFMVLFYKGIKTV